MAPDRPFLTVAEAAELIAARRLSPVELTETYLARIAALDDQLNSFVTVTAERARRDARKAEAEIMTSGPRGPLHGIPYSLKDIFDVAGVRTTAQSRLLASNVAVEDSACAAKLETAGAILLARTQHGSSPMEGRPGTCSFRRRATLGTPIIHRPGLRPARRLRSPRDLRR
jgi:aspartyl-tRNA(Asn)/glutamyl-tRNA(Gln) amidotransferase subunit A